MTREPCALGLDFGTASVRALVVETRTGRERGSAVADYRHGVIDASLPESGVRLPPDWALQHPGDYLESTAKAVPRALHAAGLEKDAIVGIGVDFTSCTILPADADARPLCLSPAWAARPHAWVKLWKHHAAQPQADRINALAEERGEAFLADYGGRTSSEWLVAKALQILEEDPELYAAAASIVEAGDWLVGELSGARVRNSCGAGYKGFWSRERGFPSKSFFGALDPRFADLESKLTGEIVPPGRRVGGLSEAMAERLGLAPGTPVGAAIIDAHSAVPAATVVEAGRMVMVLGTSTCHMLLSDKHELVEGVGGVVRDGIVEGFSGYEAGQPAVGDIFGWFARLVTGSETGFAVLEREAAQSPPGGNGLLALDWWNGNRSVLVDANLSGLILGMTLSTTAGDLYRALIEATAFSTRRILDAFEAERIPVRELIAVGGLAERSPLLLQIYADVTRRPIALAATLNASAFGAAMLGAVAAGKDGGHSSFAEAARAMAHLRPRRVAPHPDRADAYDDLYGDWRKLHDHFGRGGTDVMKRLRRGRG